MAMLFAILFPFYALLSLVLIVLVAKSSRSVILTLITLGIAIAIPYHDVIPTKILAANYCKNDPNPKTCIKKTVEYPESIYWEDNIYPGFSKGDRKKMIKQYLNGIYLKTIALNGRNDGKVYVYHYENISDGYFKATQQCEELAKEYDKLLKKFKKLYSPMVAKQIWVHARDKKLQAYKNMKKVCNVRSEFLDKAKLVETVYEKSNMPQMNYTVISNEVPLSEYASKYLYSDEIKVIENKTGEVIGYNMRLMHFFYNMFPDINVGERYYFPKPLCGEILNERTPAFLFNYLEYDGTGQRALTKKANGGLSYYTVSKNKFLYLKHKYNRGEKK